MRLHPEGLTTIKTDELKRLLRHIHRGEVEFPLDAQRVACIGFQYRQEALIHALRGMNADAAMRLIICVIAERIQAGKNSPPFVS